MEKGLPKGGEALQGHRVGSSESRPLHRALRHQEEPGIEEIYSKVIPVSSTTGAGIQNLWDELIKCANRTSKPVLSEDGLENPRAVREHVRAKIMRKKEFLEATLLKLGGKKKRGSKGKISR